MLEFRCNNDLYQPIIRALTLVKDYVYSPRQYYPEEEIVPIKDIVKAKWRDLVVEKDEDGTEKVNRINYEVCLLQALRDKVRSKEIWVVGANRYQNPDLDLPTDFEQQRTDYYEALKQPTEAKNFVEQVRTTLQLEPSARPRGCDRHKENIGALLVDRFHRMPGDTLSGTRRLRESGDSCNALPSRGTNGSRLSHRPAPERVSSRSRCTSRIGGMPKRLLYSRLK